MTVDDVIDVYVDSGLGERRPVDDRDRMARMVANANLLASAWDGDRLVGVARCVTDFVWTTYLADLAVRASYQRRGVGKGLVDAVVAAGEPGCRVVLLAAPAAVDYYPRIGFDPHPSAWVLTPRRP